MTRINCVPVAELSREHLVAEYRELPRVFALIRRAVERGETPSDWRNPLAYTLGTGHVRFFYDKAYWLVHRFYELTDEMRRRGYRVGYPDPPYDAIRDVGAGWWNDWEVTPEALAINRARIAERTKKPLDMLVKT